MTNGAPLQISIDPTDPTYQIWKRGDRVIARFSIAAAESALRVAGDALERQKRHRDGARVIIPAGVAV